MKLTKLKSNKAFTLQDAVIAIILILLFSGTIAATTVTIYKIQAGTKVDSVAMLFVVQVMERIDKLGYTEIQDDTINTVVAQMREDFSIPESFSLKLEIEPDGITNKLVKTIHVQLGYNFQGQDKNISIKTLKVKEFEGETNEK